MKMLKKLFASLLFAVLTFTATAQVTHTIVVSTTPTVNITANVGDVLHFTTVNMFTSLTMLRSTAPANISGIAGTTSFNYTILSTDTAYYVSDNSNSVYGKITVVTGIESLKHTTTKLSVFPNPSTDEVNVTFNTNKEKTTIEVFDIEGRLVMIDEATREIGQNTVKINVSNFSQGIYIVRAGTETFKITKI